MIANSVLGQRIKYYRTIHSMTQKELASAIGVAPLHIINVENGKKGISLEKLVQICELFHITPSDVLALDWPGDSELRKRWIDEILNAILGLDTVRLGTVKTMICSLLAEQDYAGNGHISHAPCRSLSACECTHSAAKTSLVP